MAIPFFLSYQVIAGWLILNLIIAAIIDGLSNAQKERTSVISHELINEYIDLWIKFDKNLTWKMNIKDFWYFLAQCPVPLGDEDTMIEWDHIMEVEGTEFCHLYRKGKNGEKNFKAKISKVMEIV